MTEAEAIEFVDDRMCYGRGKWSEHHRPERDVYWQAGELAMDALKKQIPVKPNSFGAEWNVYTCPKCGIMLDEPIGRNRIPKWKKGIAYCEGCGQAIDWSDYETD